MKCGIVFTSWSSKYSPTSIPSIIIDTKIRIFLDVYWARGQTVRCEGCIIMQMSKWRADQAGTLLAIMEPYIRAVASERPTEALASVISLVFVVYTLHQHHKYPGKEWSDCPSHVFHGHCLSHNFFLATALYMAESLEFANLIRLNVLS